MEWFVQFRSVGTDHLERTDAPEEAIALACRLLDSGHDVFGIGTGELSVSIGRDEIARIYRLGQRRAGPP
jgi:hypothetical protein